MQADSESYRSQTSPDHLQTYAFFELSNHFMIRSTMSYILHEDLAVTLIRSSTFNIQCSTTQLIFCTCLSVTCKLHAKHCVVFLSLRILTTLPHILMYVCLGVLLLLQLFFAFACQSLSPKVRYFTGASTVPLYVPITHTYSLWIFHCSRAPHSPSQWPSHLALLPQLLHSVAHYCNMFKSTNTPPNPNLPACYPLPD